MDKAPSLPLTLALSSAMVFILILASFFTTGLSFSDAVNQLLISLLLSSLD